MKLQIGAILASAVLLAYVGQASSATVTKTPAWSPMVMFGLEVTWNNLNDPSQGGSITIDGRSTTPSTPDIPPMARDLKQYGWPLEGGGTFNVGDVFGAPFTALNGTSFGRSFGWYSSGDLPAGYVWKIVQTSASPGLVTYDPYSTSFNQVFTSGSGYALRYDGNSTNYPGPDVVNGVLEYTEQMFHPVFAVPAQTGPVFANYTLYVATTNGSVVANIPPAYERFVFNATGTSLPGDANRDHIVDQADYTVWYNNYGANGGWSQGDFTGDGLIDQADYTVWYNNYGAAGGAVPEPMTLVLLSVGGMALAARRKTRKPI